MRCTLDSCVGSVWIVALALLGPIACSDDGVPQDDTGSGVTGNNDSTQTDTMPTTDDPSTTSPTATTATTDPSTDPTTDSVTSTSPTDTTDDPSESSSSADGTGTGTDTSGTDTSGSSDGSSSDESSSGSSSSDDTNGGLPTGSDCEADSDCASGVCWDFEDYDPECGGAACSVECVGDDECVQVFTDADAPTPEESFCGDDGRCWVLGTGFGAFFCAMEPAAALGG